jgi:RNA-directed DNA polymerase
MSDIIKAQQGLARKAEVNRAHHFEDLYHLLCKREWIEEALQHVLDNDGAGTAGVDGMSWKSFNDVDKSDFENEKFRQHFIETLQKELRMHTFKPMPVRRVEIPKPGTNKKRSLGIPTLKDRTVQTLLKMLMEPIWEADFLYFSNGFRPGRCTMDCVQPLYALCNTTTGYRWVIEGDIKACFDKIPHDQLVAEVARRIADPHILKLIRSFLKSGIMDHGKLAPSEEGTPQGGIVSPLLANIYLHRFDEWYYNRYGTPDSTIDRASYSRWLRATSRGRDKAATQMFRYADDWIIVIRGTQAQAQEIKEECKRFLQEELGLELSEEKTAITHIIDGFDFLGYHIFRCNKSTNGNIIGVFIQPTEKGLKRTKQKIKEMTDRKTLNDDYLHKLEAINSLVGGWASYYRAVNPSRTFDKLDRYVWIRLRRWLQKKYQISSLQVKKQYMRYRSGPEGGYAEFAAQDEEGEWIWRARATRTKLIHYRPSWKRHWPNPYLEKKRAEHFVLPTLKNIWHGNREAPIYAANRREALKRAKGCCERCGKATKLFTHHKNRVKTGKRKLSQADNRPEMLEAICFECHVKEHRAERIYQNKVRFKKESLSG